MEKELAIRIVSIFIMVNQRVPKHDEIIHTIDNGKGFDNFTYGYLCRIIQP